MKRFILRTLTVVTVVVVGLVSFITFQFHNLANRQHSTPNFSIADEMRSADPKLGHRIYAVRAGCIDCHGENLAGAVVMENRAMGSIHGVNITPAALHEWTDKEIATAIRYGIHREGRFLRFNPSFDFVGLSKDDLAALIAYIRSIPPVETTLHINTYGPVARILSAFEKMPVMFPAENIDQT
jgi:mono/diheme cytochrome c family protein